jgi:hypothetical protein
LTRVNFKRGVAHLFFCALLTSALLLAVGCTSDPASTVGGGIIDNQIDETLVSLEITALEAFSGIRVNNQDLEIFEQEVLYVGEDVDTRAMMIANYDFGDVFSDEYPDSIWTDANIVSVKLLLKKMVPYTAFPDSIATKSNGQKKEFTKNFPDSLRFFLHELEAPFLESDYTDYPAAVPPFDPTIINSDFNEFTNLDDPLLTMFKADLLSWVNNAEEIGLLIDIGPGTGAGLVGFASQDLTKFSQAANPVFVGDGIGPSIQINFADREINLVIGPIADTTVFESVAPVAESIAEANDGFLLRTGLRSYPAVRFDLAQIPENALINRAVLSVTNDTTTSYGPEFSVMVSEIVAEVMDDPSLTMDSFVLRDSSKVYPLTYRGNLRSREDYVIEFDITTGIRRAVNRVNEEPRGYLLSAVEDPSIFPFGLRPPDPTRPDFYYRQLNFLGFTDAVPELRPVLKVWYSIVDELSGGGK